MYLFAPLLFQVLVLILQLDPKSTLFLGKKNVKIVLLQRERILVAAGKIRDRAAAARFVAH